MDMMRPICPATWKTCKMRIDNVLIEQTETIVLNGADGIDTKDKVTSATTGGATFMYTGRQNVVWSAVGSYW